MPVSSQRKLPVARTPESPAPPAAVVAGIPRLKIHCASCGWRSVCLPQALNFVELGQFDQLIGRERRLRRGQSLFVAGNAFRSLYALRSGAIRTTIVAEDGREQVAGYHIEGEIIGTDGIATTRHACTAVAAMDT
jgi:CRP/FNR family transcriptional regulator